MYKTNPNVILLYDVFYVLLILFCGVFHTMTKEFLLRNIGRRVVALREAKGITQSELARLSGKDRQSIHKFENGEFNASVFYLSEIAQALQVKLPDLLSFEK
jgi:putative transcriptional regulator